MLSVIAVYLDLEMNKLFMSEKIRQLENYKKLRIQYMYVYTCGVY